MSKLIDVNQIIDYLKNYLNAVSGEERCCSDAYEYEAVISNTLTYLNSLPDATPQFKSTDKQSLLTDYDIKEIGKFIDESIERHGKRLREECTQLAKKIRGQK